MRERERGKKTGQEWFPILSKPMMMCCDGEGWLSSVQVK